MYKYTTWLKHESKMSYAKWLKLGVCLRRWLFHNRNAQVFTHFLKDKQLRYLFQDQSFNEMLPLT